MCGSPLERGGGVCPLVCCLSGVAYKHTPAIAQVHHAPSREGNYDYVNL